MTSPRTVASNWLRFGLLATLLLTLQFALSLSISPSAHAATTYFSEDFESGTFDKWNLPNGDSTGTIVNQSSVVNQGNYAASLTDTLGQYSYLYGAFPGGPQPESYTRFYFRVTAVSSTLLAMGYHNGNGSAWEATYNQFFQGFEIYFWNGAGQIYGFTTPNNSIDINTWYCVEVYLNQTTTGRAEVWINGQSVGTLNEDLSTANPYSRMMLFNDGITTVYYDDIIVSDTYNGPVNTTPTPAATLDPATVPFGNQNINTTSAVRTVTLSNPGSAPLAVDNISLAGTDANRFAQTNNCGASLSPGNSCTIDVTFTPNALSSFSANLTVATNAAGSPHTVALNGTGVNPAPGVALNPTSINFGNQQLAITSLPQTITLTNNGTAPLTINGLNITGTNTSDFAQTSTCVSPLNAGASCTIDVTFTPSATGNRTASLSIASTATSSPHTIPLNGNGVTSMSYFSDDFETGDLSKWTFGNSDSTGQTTVQSSVVHNGNDALALANDNGEFCYIHTPLPSDPVGQSYTRFYFRTSNADLGSEVAMGRNDNGVSVWEVLYNQATKSLDVYFRNEAGQVFVISSPSDSIAADTWYSIEVHLDQTTTGQAEVWLNGSSIGTLNEDFSNTYLFSQLMFFNIAASTFYIDDVSVSSTYQGPLA